MKAYIKKVLQREERENQMDFSEIVSYLVKKEKL